GTAVIAPPDQDARPSSMALFTSSNRDLSHNTTFLKVPTIHTDGKALACLIAGALCIGFAPIFVRLIDVGYTAAAFWRVALSVPVLWLLWYPRRRRDRPGRYCGVPSDNHKNVNPATC
ncbi:MAG: hypothetical protein ACHBMF_03930, partial [Chromatiales bacterium]